MKSYPTPTDDVIDSRDVIEAIADLTAQLEDELSEYDDREALTEELAALQAFAEAGADLSDWEFGETLIHDSYFETYARELADDIGAVDAHAGWPMMYIDWEAAAHALKQDYTEIRFDGQTYWGRA